MKFWPLLVIAISISLKSYGQGHGQENANPRLIVLTDMTSLQSGVREPDDAQSMIRLMLYSDEFDIEGLIASSGLDNEHGAVVRPQYIRKIVNAYAKDRPNLLLHDKQYPKADKLIQVIKSGQPVAGRKTPVFKSIGKGKDTEASDWIIKMVDKPNKRLLWITIWGGSADLAQALWKVREARSPKEVKEFIAKIRVIASGDQDATGPWIKSQFPNLFYVTRGTGGRGIYRGGDTSLVRSAWVHRNIKGHGALGTLYPDYNGGDIWNHQLGKVYGIKSGDSGTWLGLISNGLNERKHLTRENWGGRLLQDSVNPHHYHDAIDSVLGYKTDISPYLAAVYRWRPAFQAAFQARLDWCIRPYNQANHAPEDKSVPLLINKKMASGEIVKLQAGKWHDPDRNKLTFSWQFLEEESTYSKKLKIEKMSDRSAQFTAPAVKHPQSIHVLLTVTDDGSPALTSYQRFNFTVYSK